MADLAKLATRRVYGTRVAERGVLEREASRLLDLAAALQKRIALRAEDPDWLPDGDTMRVLEWYSDSVMALLKEQRQRAGMKLGGTPITDEEYQAEMTAYLTRRIQALTPEALAEIRAARPSDHHLTDESRAQLAAWSKDAK